MNASRFGELKIKMRKKKIDWTSKRIEWLNVILSSVLWGPVVVWQIMFTGTLDLTGSDTVGIVFGVWFMGQVFYAYKRDQQRLLDRLEAGGLLKNEP